MNLAHLDRSPAADPAFVEVALPLCVSHKWVAYACRTAGVAKPKWNPIHEVWTTTTKGDGGEQTISITGNGDKSIRIRVESPEADTATARRIVTAIVTAMQWEVRRRATSDSESRIQLR